MKKIIDDVFNAINEPLIKNGFEIVDIEFKKKYEQDNLTVFIYKEGGVTLDDCENAHNIIDPILDELNPTNDVPYILNVSSPGLDRPFKTQRDYERNYNKEVELRLFAPLKGKKVFEGTLIIREQNTTTIQVDSEQIKIENNKIARVSPLIRF